MQNPEPAHGVVLVADDEAGVRALELKLERLQAVAKFRKITGAGLQESKVHDVTITREAPNYRAD